MICVVIQCVSKEGSCDIMLYPTSVSASCIISTFVVTQQRGASCKLVLPICDHFHNILHDFVIQLFCSAQLIHKV